MPKNRYNQLLCSFTCILNFFYLVCSIFIAILAHPKHNQMKNKSTSCLIVLALLISSCGENKVSSTLSGDEKFTPLSHQYLKTDTLRFSIDSTKMIVSGIMKSIKKTDSLQSTPLDVMYYKNGKQIASFSGEIESEGDEELSHYFEDADTNGNSCERFFTVAFGYPACGYTQHKHTFSIDEKSLYLLAKHESSADGGYGSGIQFSNLCKGVNGDKVSSVYVSYMPSETDEQLIYTSYTDSVEYTFKGKNWENKEITEKGKEFRTGQERW